jgi:CubicO group peptidase (beta-lactamase class C family)
MAAGMSWEDLSAERLYDRAGMSATSSIYQDYADSVRRADLHVRVDGEWEANYQRKPDAQSPAGGVSSSLRDVMTWLRLQLGEGTLDGEEIISAAALAETHRPQIVSNPPRDPSVNFAGFYGLGWNVSYESNGLVRLSHSGAFALGAATAVTLLPAYDLGIAVLSNGMPIGVPEAIIASFVDLVQTGEVQRDYVELFGELFVEVLDPGYESDYDSPPDPVSPALDSSSYVGVYANAFFGEIEVAESDGSLKLYLGPEPIEHDLTHYDRDVFLYQPVGEMAGGLSAVTFELDPTRQASSVTLQILDIGGQGTFSRVE